MSGVCCVLELNHDDGWTLREQLLFSMNCCKRHDISIDHETRHRLVPEYFLVLVEMRKAELRLDCPEPVQVLVTLQPNTPLARFVRRRLAMHPKEGEAVDDESAKPPLLLPKYNIQLLPHRIQHVLPEQAELIVEMHRDARLCHVRIVECGSRAQECCTLGRELIHCREDSDVAKVCKVVVVSSAWTT